MEFIKTQPYVKALKKLRISKDEENHLYEEIMAGLREALEIEKGLKKPDHVVKLPDNPKNVRKKLNLSQAQFSRFLGIKTDTLRNWEYGRRRMPETARRLIFIAEKHPEIILEMV